MVIEEITFNFKFEVEGKVDNLRWYLLFRFFFFIFNNIYIDNFNIVVGKLYD